METKESAPTIKRAEQLWLLFRQYNWRMALIRVLVNGLALITIVLLVPEINFVDRYFGSILLLGAILGILNAIVKPAIQFITLPLIFASYGFVIVVINALMLILLAALFPGLLAVNSLVWALVGGALMGILAGLLESIFGLNIPLYIPEALGSSAQATTQPQPVGGPALPAEEIHVAPVQQPERQASPDDDEPSPPEAPPDPVDSPPSPSPEALELSEDNGEQTQPGVEQ